MTVVLTSPAYGLQPLDEFTGTAKEEAWLLASGYAKQTGYDANTAAVLTGTSNAVNVVTGGNIVVRVGHEEYTVAIASADTPAQAATKIDTALTGVANAAIVSSKLEISTVATGDDDAASVSVVSGTGTVLANLGVVAGASAVGTTGGIGTANYGVSDVSIANNPEFDTSRGQIAAGSDLPEGGTNDGVVLKDADAPYISLQGGAFGDQESSAFVGFANDPATADRPVEFGSVLPATGPAAGGTVVEIRGFGLDKVTSVTFGGVAGTSLTHDGRQSLTVTTGAHAAGVVDIVLVHPGDDVTETAGFTYTA
jgi:hypothetical protein